MNSRELTKLFVNIAQIINLLRTVNIHRDAFVTHSQMDKQVMTKLDKLRAQYEDKEYMKTLSPAEQQALLTNAQNLFGVHKELEKEIEYLDLTKQPTFITSAVNELDKAYLLTEYLLFEIVGKNGEIILPHLITLNPKTFEGGKYKNQIDSLYSEIEAQAHDFYTDQIITKDHVNYYLSTIPMLIPICDHLTLAACWVGKEKQRLLTEAFPEIRVIKLPEEVVPEIPKAPEEFKAKMDVVKDPKTE